MPEQKQTGEGRQDEAVKLIKKIDVAAEQAKGQTTLDQFAKDGYAKTENKQELSDRLKSINDNAGAGKEDLDAFFQREEMKFDLEQLFEKNDEAAWDNSGALLKEYLGFEPDEQVTLQQLYERVEDIALGKKEPNAAFVNTEPALEWEEVPDAPAENPQASAEREKGSNAPARPATAETHSPAASSPRPAHSGERHAPAAPHQEAVMKPIDAAVAYAKSFGAGGEIDQWVSEVASLESTIRKDAAKKFIKLIKKQIVDLKKQGNKEGAKELNKRLGEFQTRIDAKVDGRRTVSLWRRINPFNPRNWFGIKRMRDAKKLETGTKPRSSSMKDVLREAISNDKFLRTSIAKDAKTFLDVFAGRIPDRAKSLGIANFAIKPKEELYDEINNLTAAKHSLPKSAPEPKQ